MRLFWFSLCLGAAAFCGHAQTPVPGAAPSGTVIKAESRLVLVDALVRDKKGKFVRDLQAKEFRVWEDGKEQPISSLTQESQAQNQQNAQKQYIVLFVDGSTVTPADALSLRRDLTTFVDSFAAADRYMAVVNFTNQLTITQNFTTSGDALKKAIAAAQTIGQREDAQPDIPVGRRPASGTNSAVRSASAVDQRNLLISIRAIADSVAYIRGRKTMVFLSAGFDVAPNLMSDLSAAIRACNKANMVVYTVDARGMHAGLAPPAGSQSRWAGLGHSLSGALGLLPVASPGSLSRSFFQTSEPSGQTGSSSGQTGTGSSGSSGTGSSGSSGSSGTGSSGSTGSSSSDSSSGSTAPPPAPARSGAVTGDSSDPFGDMPGMIASQSNAAALTARMFLRSLAGDTGGRAIENTNALRDELGAVVAEQGEYYLIGYIPPQTPEGSCHEIRVKVSRGGTEVLARKEYCSVKALDLLAGKPAAKTVEERAATAPPVKASVQLPFFYRSANIARVNLATDLPVAGLKFQKVKNKQHAELNVVGVASTPGGEVAARFSDVVNFDFDSEKQAKDFAAQPFRYENQFDIAAGDYVLRLSFGAGESFGRAEAPLKVEQWDAKRLAVSGVALGANVRKVPDLTSDLEEALLDDRRPLMFRSMQISPSGNDRCARASQCLSYFEVYDPLLAGEQPPKVAVQVRILDGKTGAERQTSGVFDLGNYIRPGNPVVPVAVNLPVKNLEPGAYVVEIKAAHSSGEDSPVRTLNLVVE